MKVNVQVSLKNETTKEPLSFFLGKGIKSEHDLCYQEKDTLVTVTWNKRLVLKRKTKEYELLLPFEENKKTEGKFQSKNPVFIAPLWIETKKIIQQDHKIELVYQIEEDSYHLEIKDEVIE